MVSIVVELLTPLIEKGDEKHSQVREAIRSHSAEMPRRAIETGTKEGRSGCLLLGRETGEGLEAARRNGFLLGRKTGERAKEDRPD